MKEEALQMAVEEFQQTQGLPLAPSQKLFANSLLSKTPSGQEGNALNIQRCDGIGNSDNLRQRLFKWKPKGIKGS